MGLHGETATSAPGVGAHQQHLGASTWHAPIQCEDCHLVPADVSDPGHIDTQLPAELTFSALAKSDGATPSYSSTTCSGVYCHGATLSGGSATSPVWTQVDGSQATCTSCHGMPPSAGHPASSTCASCHTSVVDSSNKIIQPALHIDGKVSAAGAHGSGYGTGTVHGPDFLKDPNACKACHGSDLTGGSGKSCESCHPGWKKNCTFCHGGQLNQTGAPPYSVDNKTATSVPGVGRHTGHVAGAGHPAYGCQVCHDGKVPVDALTPGHIDPSPAEVAFGGLGAGSSYSFSTNMCANVYCHGNGKAGSSGSALWVGSLSGGCSACHDDETDGGNMTLSGRHKKHVAEKGFICSICHGCVVDSSKQITDKSKHVNGQKDVCLPSWNPTTKSCSPPCHGTKSW